MCYLESLKNIKFQNLKIFFKNTAHKSSNLGHAHTIMESHTTLIGPNLEKETYERFSISVESESQSDIHLNHKTFNKIPGSYIDKATSSEEQIVTTTHKSHEPGHESFTKITTHKSHHHLTNLTIPKQAITSLKLVLVLIRFKYLFILFNVIVLIPIAIAT